MNGKLAFNVDEAAEVMSLSRRMLYELIRSDQLGSIKVGSRRLIRRTDIEAFLAKADTEVAA